MHSMKQLRHYSFSAVWSRGVVLPLRVLGLFSLCGVGAAGADPSAPVPASLSQVDAGSVATPVVQFTLDNGLTLIVKTDHRAPTAVHMLWLRVGAMEEVDGTSGVAHVLEHMMFKGTPQVPAGEFSRRVAALGGRENAFTAKDYTGFYQQIPAQRLEDVMRLESDRFSHSQWDDSAFWHEIEVVKEERRMRTEDSPHARLEEALDAATFQASPYRRPVLGWMSDLDAMTPDDVHDFYQRWYVPANAAVVVAGDVDPQAVLALAQKYYGVLPGRTLPVRKPRVEPEQVGLRRLDFKAPAEQALVVLQFKIPHFSAAALDPAHSDAASDDVLALTVLAAVLSGYDNARLERTLTQASDHVADTAQADCGLAGRGPQLCVLYGVVAAGKTAAQVEAALRAQVADIARNGVHAEELRRVKNQWLAGMIYQQDSVFNQARLLGVNWVNGFPVDADERLIARLRSVTGGQVQAAAARYFGDDALTVATLLPQPLDPKRVPRPSIPGLRY